MKYASVCLLSLLLTLSACHTDESVVEADALAYLVDRYGRNFQITEVKWDVNEGKGIKDDFVVTAKTVEAEPVEIVLYVTYETEDKRMKVRSDSYPKKLLDMDIESRIEGAIVTAGIENYTFRPKTGRWIYAISDSVNAAHPNLVALQGDGLVPDTAFVGAKVYIFADPEAQPEVYAAVIKQWYTIFRTVGIGWQEWWVDFYDPALLEGKTIHALNIKFMKIGEGQYASFESQNTPKQRWILYTEMQDFSNPDFYKELASHVQKIPGDSL